MKKLTLAILLTFVSSTFLQARQVDLEKALQAAKTYVRTQPQLKSSHIDDIRLAYISTDGSILKSSKDEEAVYYYVFNIGNENGFVIIAGDYAAKPLLGYSPTGYYDKNNLPPNFSYWMNCLQKEIAYAVKNEITPDEETNAEWEAYLTGNITLKANTSVGPLISTTWSQTDPYNLFCPPYKDEKLSVTGCVATAMAQLMKYYGYPAAGTGSSEAYQTETYHINVPAVDLSTGYDWKNMTNTYTASSAPVEKEEVAKLMYHCGVSVEMDYGDLSGARSSDAAKALIRYFNYDKSLQLKSRDHITQAGKQFFFYSDAEWSSMMRNEIDARRPIYYSGTDDKLNGHAFICDGYDLDMFHFNWGWNGRYDGYFAFTALNPGKSDHVTGEGVYRLYQDMIIGIQPNINGSPNYEIKMIPETPLQSSKSSVNKGEAFEVKVHYSNNGGNDFTGFFGVALTNEFGDILEIIGDYFRKEVTLPASLQFAEALSVSCAVSNNISSGTYKIRPAVKPSYGDWVIITGVIEQANTLNLEVKNNGVAVAANLRLYDIPITPDRNPIRRNEPLAVEVGIANMSSLSDFLGDIDLGIYTTSGELLQTLDSRRINLPLRTYSVLSFHSPEITVPPGNYKLTFYGKTTTGERTIVSSNAGLLNGINISVEEGSGINNATDDIFSVYPNPVNDVLYLQLDDNQLIKSIKLTDLSGRTVKSVSYEQNMNQIEIPVNNLNSGIYLLVIQTEKDMITEKIIKK